MAKFNLNMLVLMAIVVASVAFYGSAEKYPVGDTFGWTNPENPLFYNEWASVHTFVAGDKLYFDFHNQKHDVAIVSQDAFHECNTDGANIIIKDGPDGTVDLVQGNHFFISTVGEDCKLHQKFPIFVANATL